MVSYIYFNNFITFALSIVKYNVSSSFETLYNLVVEQMASQTWCVQNWTLNIPNPGPHPYSPIPPFIQSKKVKLGSYLFFTKAPTPYPQNLIQQQIFVIVGGCVSKIYTELIYYWLLQTSPWSGPLSSLTWTTRVIS